VSVTDGVETVNWSILGATFVREMCPETMLIKAHHQTFV